MLDLYSDEFRRNPYPAYELLRRTSPVLHEPDSKSWMIFDYDGVKRALTDQESFSSSIRGVEGRGNPEWLIFFDPPRHTRLRGIVSQAFTPRSIASLEPRIRELSRDLLDRVVERGEMDLVADYAVPLPMMVIAEMIGIPPEDWSRFRRWSDSILKLSLTLNEGAEEAEAAIAEFGAVHAETSAYLPDLIAERQRVPLDDLLTRLVQAEVEGERLTEEEIVGFFQALLVAGNETTANLIDNAVVCLLDHPEQLALLRAEPDLLSSAIEEVLRYRSPFQFTFRATKRDVELSGQVIPAGKLVLANVGSANRDERYFPDPNRFDIARDPNPHIAFGAGIHFCLGAPLARLEARVALFDLLERLPGMRLASSKPWEPRKALHVHGPTRLPIRFEASRAAVA